MRLRTDGRGAGGDIVGVRGCARTGSLGDAGVGNAGQDGATLARRDHRCRHGRSSRVRDAEQGPTRAGSHAYLERYPAPHANTSIEEATTAARTKGVGLAAGCRRQNFRGQVRPEVQFRSRVASPLETTNKGGTSPLSARSHVMGTLDVTFTLGVLKYANWGSGGSGIRTTHIHY